MEYKGDPKMKKAYKAAAKINQKTMEKENPEHFKYLRDVKESDIIIVRGGYDHGEVVFELCSIPYSLINPEELAGIELKDEQILYINCPGHIENRGLERIKSFVHNGGMLVTTDWALTNVLEKAFPGHVQYNKRATSDDVVRVVFEDIEDTFLKGLLDPEDEPVWWLEGSSYPIKVLNSDKVKVLVSSKEMKEKYGEAPIVITFEVGEGKIYHMTSHFYLQRSETRSTRHQAMGTNYAYQKGISMSEFTEEEAQALQDVQVVDVEAAYTSIQSVYNMTIEQKIRVEKRKNKKEK